MCFFPRDLVAPAAEPAWTIDWEEPACLLCGGRSCSHLVEAPDHLSGDTGLWFAVVQCQECGLCFTSPRPTPDTIGQFYPTSYPPHRPPRSRPGQARQLPPAGTWKRLRRPRRALPWHGEGRLLDFGCGGGSFLARLHRQGWQVTGLDVSPAAVQRVRADLGLRAFVGSLPHPQLEPGGFDVITMWHSLEHVHEPLDVLKEARRLLAPGGKLVVAVPNIDSLPFRWFGGAWFGLDLPRHLTHFSPWTLALTLQRAGFRPDPVRMVRHNKWLRASARLACRRPRSPHWHRWLQAGPASRLATWYSSLTSQADCMLVVAENP